MPVVEKHYNMNELFQVLYSETHNLLLKFTICWKYLLKLGINFKIVYVLSKEDRLYFLLKHKTSLIYKILVFETFILGMLQLLEFLYLEYSAIENTQSVISELAVSQKKDWLFDKEEMTFQFNMYPWILERATNCQLKNFRFNKCDFVLCPSPSKNVGSNVQRSGL